MNSQGGSNEVTGRVLLADDHDGYRKTIARLLERAGCQVVDAACGEDVLAEAARQPFDVFVLDYKMPGNEELALVGKIKAIQPETPIIILTGYASLPSAMNAVRLQLFDYIPKDERSERLIGRIVEAIRRTRLERRVKVSEEQYRVLAENVQDMITVFTPELKVFYVSPSVQLVMGYSAEEFMELNILDLVHPDDLPALQRDVGRVLSGELIQDQALRFLNRNGDYVFLSTSAKSVSDGQGGVREIITSTRDVTQHRQQHEALQQREACLTAIIENQPGMVWLKDTQSRYLAVNHFLVRASGRQSASEIIGRTDHEIWPADLADQYVRDDRMVMAQKRTVVLEERMCDSSGLRWVESFKAPVISSSGEVLGTTGFAHVITDRKQAEEELKASELRYQKLAHHLEVVREEERKRFSRELHDDIGQIFTALKIDLAQVMENVAETSPVKNKMHDMQTLLSDGIQRVHSLCRRLRPGALDDLSLEDALIGLTEDWKNRNSATCVLYADVDDAALSDEIKTAVFRMVQEALTNVSRYARAGRVEISLVADDQTLSVLIADDGCGMAEGSADKSASFGLLGMRERLEALGGTLTLESAPGKGLKLEGIIPLNQNKRFV